MNTLKITRKAAYAIIEINNGKVNAINTELSKDLTQAFNELDRDESVPGVILTGRPHCFSAGLDMVNLSQGGIEGAKEFWQHYLGALQAMIRFSKPFICAITGYAPAGGTILTLCADYRIMGQGTKHVMGMHEFKMSMQIPELLCDIYAYYLGEKLAWKYVQEARLFNSDQALALGLVDESVEVDEVIERAETHIQKLVKVYAPVYKKSKRYLRKGLLQLVDREIDPMVADIVKDLSDPFVLKTIELFLASLKK